MDQQKHDLREARSTQQQKLDRVSVQLSGWAYKIFALFLIVIVVLELADLFSKETLIQLHQINLATLLAAPFVRTIVVAKVMVCSKDWLAVGGSVLTFLVVALFLSSKIL